LGSDYDLFDYLDRLLQRSCAVVDAAAGGIMLDNGRGELQVMAATDERMRLLELFEVQGDEGPCVEAYELGDRVVVDDLGASERWPRFTPTAVERGFVAALAFPLRWRTQSIGALNLFCEQPGPVEQVQLRGAQAMAQMAAIGILQERAVREARELAGHLQTALNSRVIIEQAKGILAERGDLDMGAAYEALRTYCRNHNARLRETAAAVVNGTLAVSEVLAAMSPP
jgi:GAF domain-containing protein